MSVPCVGARILRIYTKWVKLHGCLEMWSPMTNKSFHDESGAITPLSKAAQRWLMAAQTLPGELRSSLWATAYSVLMNTKPWWHHQMETFFALLALCAGNLPVTGEFPSQRPVTRSFDVFFDLRLHKWLSKQSGGWWFETPLRSLSRHCNANHKHH